MLIHIQVRSSSAHKCPQMCIVPSLLGMDKHGVNHSLCSTGCRILFFTRWSISLPTGERYETWSPKLRFSPIFQMQLGLEPLDITELCLEKVCILLDKLMKSQSIVNWLCPNPGPVDVNPLEPITAQQAWTRVRFPTYLHTRLGSHLSLQENRLRRNHAKLQKWLQWEEALAEVYSKIWTLLPRCQSSSGHSVHLSPSQPHMGWMPLMWIKSSE